MARILVRPRTTLELAEDISVLPAMASIHNANFKSALLIDTQANGAFGMPFWSAQNHWLVPRQRAVLLPRLCVPLIDARLTKDLRQKMALDLESNWISRAASKRGEAGVTW